MVQARKAAPLLFKRQNNTAMRPVPYTEIKKRMKLVGEEDGYNLWLFEPGDLNGSLAPWESEYMDPIIVRTGRKSFRDAAQKAASANLIKLTF